MAATITGHFVYFGQPRRELPRNMVLLKVNSGIPRIPVWTFHSLLSLRKVELPDRLHTIGDHAFFRCVSLENISFPCSLKEIENNAFEGCSSLETVRLPDGVKSIGAATFRSCTSLKSLRIPATVNRIGTCAFAGCSGLISIDLPESLNFISGWFLRCESLRMVTLPSIIHSIAPQAFFGCSNLVSLEIPDGVSSIWGESFAECASLRNVFIPPSVVKLESTFDGCTQLQQLFPDEDVRLHALRSRFDGFPVHEICYFQSHHNTATSLEKVRNAAAKDETHYKQDVLGMTCFHILAMSVKPNVRLWKKLLDNSPKNILRVADKWGSLPIDYLMDNKATATLSLLCSTIQAMTAETVKSLGLASWKMKVLKLVEEISDDTDRRNQVHLIFQTLAKYARQEALSLLELALWKCKIHDLICERGIEGRAQKKLKIDRARSIRFFLIDCHDRESCRINCGTEVIIPNILPFLGLLRNQVMLINT
eukprot:scaffold20012_cov179-Cylindrotheca_fusiformis.AAC.2